MPTTQIKRCRLCGGGDLQFLYTLGDHLVNDFPATPDGAILRCPIDILLCKSCTLVQQAYTVDPAILYKSGYWYSSGTTQTMRRMMEGLVTDYLSRWSDPVGRLPGTVLDIGSNDGTMLGCWNKAHNCIGFEPAPNFHAQPGTYVFKALWDADLYLAKFPQADVITALGMLYDLDNPNKFIADVARALAPNGLFIAQLMMLDDMVAMRDIGNLCHEHLEFYSCDAMGRLLEAHGLCVQGVQRVDINGRSTRLYIKHKTWEYPSHCNTFNLRIAEEQERGVHTDRWHLERFVRPCVEAKDHLWNFIKCADQDVSVYGASTKGNTALQYFGLGSMMVDSALDVDERKVGRYTVNGIPIRKDDGSKLRLVMPYGFLQEFCAKEREWLRSGGQFIVINPNLRLVGEEVLL